MSEGILVYGFPVSGNPPTIGGGPIIPPSPGLPPVIGGGPIIPPTPGLPPVIGGGPIYPPNLPGVWPPPGQVVPPIHIPPGGIAMPPVFIPDEPGHPLPKPPGTIWPPLPPDAGIEGKVAILVWVVGIGWRWFIYEAPPVAGPK